MQEDAKQTSYKVLLLDKRADIQGLADTIRHYGIDLICASEQEGLRRLAQNTEQFDLVIIGRHANRNQCETFLSDYPLAPKYIVQLLDDQLLTQQIRAARTAELDESVGKITKPIYGKAENGLVLQLTTKQECIVLAEQFYQGFFLGVHREELYGGNVKQGVVQAAIKSDRRPLYISVTVDFKDVYILTIEKDSH